MKLAFRKWRVKWGLSWHKCAVPGWFLEALDCYMRAVSQRARRWSTVWAALGMVFCVVVYVVCTIPAAGLDVVTLPVQLLLRRRWKKQAQTAAAVAKALREANQPPPPPPPLKPKAQWNPKKFPVTVQWVAMGAAVGVGYALWSQRSAGRRRFRYKPRKAVLGTVARGAGLGAGLGIVTEAVICAGQAAAALTASQNPGSGVPGQAPQLKSAGKNTAKVGTAP